MYFKEPCDALDYALSSIYIHDEDFMVPKMYVFMQPETLNLQSWRQLRNELTVKINYNYLITIFCRKFIKLLCMYLLFSHPR